MEIQLLTLESSKEDWANSAYDLYDKKLKYFCKYSRLAVKADKIARNNAQEKKEKDSELILQKIKDNDIVVLLDERGKSLSSEKFAEFLNDKIQISSKRLVFVIGGAYGSSESLMRRANFSISLSTMVFNHHIAQAVLLEQIYRAFTIIKSIPYHNA